MKIECKLKRNGGTKVDLDGFEYHFKPLPDNKHVAIVDIDSHIERFLAISEAYCIYRGLEQVEATSTQAVEQKKEPLIFLAGSSVHAPQYEIHGKTYTITEVIRKSIADQGITADKWNSLTEEERGDFIDEALDSIESAEKPKEKTRDELIEEYKEKFGKAPHGNITDEKLKKLLESE